MNVTLIKNYSVKSGDVFFFDANIWMYIFGPYANSKKYKQQAYSNLLRDIQLSRASVFISSLVVSEYVNACLRISFNNWRKLPENVSARDFKLDYRGTDNYIETIQDLKSQVCDIFKIADKTPDSFNSVDVLSFFDMQDIDFNDAYHIELCKGHSNKMILVTDDKDILNSKNSCIQMLTADAY